eukprot:11110744-Karenia_brevis.AAC.1
MTTKAMMMMMRMMNDDDDVDVDALVDVDFHNDDDGHDVLDSSVAFNMDRTIGKPRPRGMLTQSEAVHSQ